MQENREFSLGLVVLNAIACRGRTEARILVDPG
jgi:hypothetical protein